MSKQRADELATKDREEAKKAGQRAAKVRLGNEEAQLSLPLRLLPSPQGDKFLMCFSDKPKPNQNEWMPSQVGIWVMLYQLHILTGQSIFELRDTIEAKLSAILADSPVKNPQFEWHLMRSLERRLYLKQLLKKAEQDIQTYPGQKQFVVIRKRLKYLLTTIDFRFKDRNKDVPQDNTVKGDAKAVAEAPIAADPQDIAEPQPKEG